ncbi:MAG: efflux RND transporter periplasmic adaptor subunit [Flavobacteriales bacterium]|nr:efflux RND transporter periplasmic adaptor subunit [Flavobacteriales bacterium]
MNKIIISFVILVTLFTACRNEHNHKSEHGHSHGNEAHIELEPLAYTIYTERSELFVEFKPLIVGKTSKFAAHFTQLGENFTAVTEGSVTISLIGNEKQPSNKADSPSSPGIFRLNLNPKNEGIYTLVFDIQTKEFSDKITIDSVFVFPDTKSALEYVQESIIGEEIVYLKEQAWKIEFANAEVKRRPFAEIFKTTGQILPAQGDEVVLTAKSNGIITFGNSKKLIGSAVSSGETLFSISGQGLIENNLDAKYTLAKANYEKANKDFERSKKLAKDDIIPQKDFQEIQLRYENYQTVFNTTANNYTAGGQKIISPIQGYLKSVMVTEGEYVEIGQPLARVSQNQKLILTAEVSQKHFSKLNSISSANFKTAYNDRIYSTNSLNGRLISYGKSTNDNAYYIPVNFEIDNKGEIIPGSFIEVFLKTNVIKDALIIPYTALIEEQGNYYAYVQTSGEGFQKRELKLGAKDGMSVQVLSGIKANERVVIKGAYQIKLATMSGKMPAHGHEH